MTWPKIKRNPIRLRDPGRTRKKRYATLDEVYHTHVYPLQVARHEDKGMLDWAVEDFESLTWQSQMNADPEQHWADVKAAGRLFPTGLTLFRLLFIWRNAQACKDNVPKRQVLRDRTLSVLGKFTRLLQRDCRY